MMQLLNYYQKNISKSIGFNKGSLSSIKKRNF